MQRQDIPASRTAQDLERKYNFEKMVADLKNNVDLLNSAKNDIKNFTVETLKALEGIENEVDGKVDTYYFSGVPTLINEPTSNWNPDDYESHIGDLYYDTSSGIPYYFSKVENSYLWQAIDNKNIKEALAVANAAKDTADKKRRVFLEEPTTPYDNGDLWLDNGDLYVCQISKNEDDIFDFNDFIIATKYTDDTEAHAFEDKLEVVKGQVLTILDTVNQFQLNFEETIKTINDLQQETIESLRNMSYTFGTREFKIADSTDPFNLRINNRGLKIYYYDALNAIFNKNGSGFGKLIATNSIQLGHLKAMPNSINSKHFSGSKQGVSIYYLNQMIETLSDLEAD